MWFHSWLPVIFSCHFQLIYDRNSPQIQNKFWAVIAMATRITKSDTKKNVKLDWKFASTKLPWFFFYFTIIFRWNHLDLDEKQNIHCYWSCDLNNSYLQYVHVYSWMMIEVLRKPMWYEYSIGNLFIRKDISIIWLQFSQEEKNHYYEMWFITLS